MFAGVSMIPAIAGAASAAPAGEVTVPIGGTFVVQGTGCLFGEDPGTVSIGLSKPGDPDRVGYLPSDGTVTEPGNWKVKATIPKTWRIGADAPTAFEPGTYNVVIVCEDSEDEGLTKPLTGDITVVHVTGGEAAPTTTVSPGSGPSTTKPAAPKPPAVKTTPHFTG